MICSWGGGWVISVCGSSFNQVLSQGKLLSLTPLVKFIKGPVFLWQVIIVGKKELPLGDLSILSYHGWPPKYLFLDYIKVLAQMFKKAAESESLTGHDISMA